MINILPFRNCVPIENQPINIYFNIQFSISYIDVAPSDITIIVILLSFEKFLSKTPAKNPISPKDTAYIPACFPSNRSNVIPIPIPYAVPIVWLANSPTNNIKIIYRFGITPEMLNQLKKFDCR